MKAQIINDVIVSYGNHLLGDNLYDIPDDYSPERYFYTPSTPGVFDPNGFETITQIVVIKTWIKQLSNSMINITIQDGRAEFINSVMGQINEQIELAEVVDETRLHLHLSTSVFMISIQQYTFNDQQFDTAQAAVVYIDNL